MSEPVLNDNDLAEALSAPDAPAWELIAGRLLKTVSCAGFVGSLAYVNEVGALAEAANHHPDIDLRWDTVTLRLTTHSAGGLTRRDLDLAGAIDRVG
jgi:4a-hydroxytetrahydrobiopterin dehydratase